MEPNCIELDCSECCRRYWIFLLPSEAKRLAKSLGIPEAVFIRQKCVIALHLYPRQESGKPLTINSVFLPKKARAFIEQQLGNLPQNFLALPYIALKRTNGNCVLLKNSKCIAHSAAPDACRLFPNISLNQRPLKELYSFCAALQQKGNEQATGSLDKALQNRTKQYFAQVQKKGFAALFPALPKKAILLLEGEKELSLAKKEALQAIKAA